MKNCASCGAANPTEARFCVNCGSALAPRCPRCGTELPGLVRFCPACGAAIQETREGAQERKLVTVLFADLSGSTGLGELLDPEQLKDIMDAYFRAMRREIEAEGGTVEKFIGDAVMAAFGVPASHEDDPSRALRAALRMGQGLADLNGQLRSDHGVTLAMRIGINTGEVMVVAHPLPGEGMVVGDSVNVAARLEQSAEPGQILVSERTARASKGIRFQELGPLKLRGKGQTVQALEVVGAEPGEDRARGLRPPMVGRDQEMALLQTVYRRVAAESRPHLVTIYGEAGVGKSRFIDELAAWAGGQDPPARLLVGRCLPYGEGVTYWPLAEILKGESHVLDNDPPGVAIEKVRTLTEDLLAVEMSADTDQVAAALAFTVGLPGSDRLFAGMEPRQIRAEVVQAWTAFFSALAATGPAIVEIEDAHWADSAMLDLLEELADRVEGSVLFLCSARPELTARRPDWGGGRWNFSSVLLEPLTAEQASALLAHVLVYAWSEEQMDPELRATILERAGGNPFFLEEIVKHQCDERQLGGADGALGIVIPDTVQGVLAARMDLLGPLEKRTLQAAAVVGRVFWVGPVAQLEGAERAHLDDVLDRLRERGLILARLSSTMAGEREFIFKHVLTRDVAYESLPRRERATAHAQVARWIEETAGERQLELGELLAHHYGEAYRGTRGDLRQDPALAEGLRGKAFRFALLASETTRNQMALDKAERLARSAVALADRPLERSEALEALGRALSLDFQGDLAWESLKEAIDLRVQADPEASADIMRLCALALEVVTHARGAMRTVLSHSDVDPYLEIASAHLANARGEDSARILAFQAYWPWMFREGPGDPERIEEARRAGERAADLAVELGRPEIASLALDGVGQYYLRQGLYGKMDSVLDRRLKLASTIQDPWELGDIFATTAWADYVVGRYTRAVAMAAEGFERAQRGAPAQALHCLDWGALARCRLGDWQGFFADAALIADLLGGRSERPPGFAADHLGAAAMIREVQGDPASADRLLRILRWLEETEERPSPVWMAWVALVHARRGAFAEAWDMLERIDNVAPGPGRGLRLEALCDVLCEQGAWGEVEGTVAAAREHSDLAGLLALPLFASRAEGRTALFEGDPVRARGPLGEASAGFAELGATWEQARTDLFLAEALAASGEPVEARAHLASAMKVFERLRSEREAALAADLSDRLR